jgi:carboxypeptidase Q
MHSPMAKSLPMLGLGGSVGTGVDGITAEVLVVNSYEDLDRLKDSVAGKIVLYNNAWNNSYSQSVVFRSRGAVKAAQYGAVGALVRSVTPFSLQTPHTGGTNYDPAVTKIPIAAITVEDAAWMGRMSERGNVNITITLKMGAERLPPTTSYNVIADLVGSSHPSEFVVMGGHTDSWDVGQGAQDDAGGVFVAWEALRIIKTLGLQPKRTIRVVGWVDEEQGGAGARQYVIDHQSEIPHTILAMESDQGTFKATNMLFKGTSKGFSGAAKIGTTYLTKLMDVKVQSSQSTDADITPLSQQGVPCFSLRTAGNILPSPKYFEYHHTHADTFDKIALSDFQNNAAVFAITAWVAAQGEWNLQ